jgi:general secretion pathway protein K
VSLRRQRGVALLVAIVIFAIATTVAAAVTYNKAMSARRAAATFTLEAALQAGMAAEALASIALEDAGSKTQITLTQDWAQVQPPLEIPDTGIWIQAHVEDLNSRFNLNSLVKKDPNNNGDFIEDTYQLAIFRDLLSRVDVDPKYATLLLDWIDPNITPDTSGGGEDTLYLSQAPPYRPPNTFITHPSELLALPGFGRENYQKLAPFVTALPFDEKVNTCTARGHVLDAVLNENTSQHADEEFLKTQRKNGCWPDRNTFLNGTTTATNRTDVQGHIEETSRWFRLRTQVRIGTADFVLYSVLYLEAPKNTVRVLQRSFGSE